MKLIKTIANCCLVFITVIAVCVIIAFVYYHYFVKDTTIGVNNVNDQLAVDIKKDDELTDEEKDAYAERWFMEANYYYPTGTAEHGTRILHYRGAFMDEITNNKIAVEKSPAPVTTMKKRWLLTINNPIFADSGYTEINPSDTDLEVKENHYDLSVLQEDENKDFFEFRYIRYEQDGNAVLIKRPFFKDLESIEKYFKNLKDVGGLKYAVYQYERGENGTPHIQGFIIYKNSKRFVNVKQDFPTAHIIVPRGSNLENRDYCTKTDTRIAPPVEIGEFSEMRTRNDITQFFEALKLGADNILLKNMFPVLYSQYGPEKIERFRQDELKAEYGKKFRNVSVTYIYGIPRTGKTTYIYDNYPIEEICRIDNYLKGTFEAYDHQKILVLDEFTGKIDLPFLNNLLDKFPVQLPARFANRTACFEQVFIISNLPLDRLYKDEQNAAREVYNAFIARIQNIIKFTALGVWHYEKKDGKQVPPPKQAKLSDLVPIEDDGDLPF